MRLTQKQRNFVLDVFADITPSTAYLTHYKCKPSASYALASRLQTNAKVQDYLHELRKKAENASVANVLERKQRLTEILRANIPDFITEDGIKVEKKSPNVGAVSEITTKTKVYRKTGEAVNITNLKLHSPIQAADLLNKMEKIYSDGVNINVPIKVEAQVVHIDSREIAAAIFEAYRLGLTPAILGGDGHGEDASILSSPTNIQAVTIPEPKD